MHQKMTDSLYAIYLEEFAFDLNIASTFLDSGMELISGDSVTKYPKREYRDRGLLQLEAYREHINKVIAAMEDLRKSIDS